MVAPIIVIQHVVVFRALHILQLCVVADEPPKARIGHQGRGGRMARGSVVPYIIVSLYTCEILLSDPNALILA